MKKVLLSILSVVGLSAYVSAQGECIELFISEYVEGWGNNKALELYNPTDEAKDLSNYRLERYSNGSPSASSNQRLILEGTIEPYSTFVVVIDKRDPEGEGQEAPVWDELQEKADAFECPVYNENNTMYFNGNDAIVLRNIAGGGNGFVIDVIGRIGQDPSGGGDFPEGWNNIPPEFTWAANGAESWTRDKSMIRKFDVAIGDFDGQNPFDPSVEWDSIPPVIINDEELLVGNWESLGSHDCTCFPLSNDDKNPITAKIYPNPLSADQMLNINSEIELTEISIFDITGKTILRERITSLKQIQISVTEFEKGIYLLTGTDGQRSFTQKLIIN